jgi:hypothetical protein
MQLAEIAKNFDLAANMRTRSQETMCVRGLRRARRPGPGSSSQTPGFKRKKPDVQNGTADSIGAFEFVPP